MLMGATAAEGVTGECEMGDTTEYAPRATNTHARASRHLDVSARRVATRLEAELCPCI